MRFLKRKLSCLVLAAVFAAALLASSGCEALLEDERLIESKHLVTQNVKPPVEQTEVSNYDELKAALLDLVMQHVDSGQILYNSFDDDIQDEIERACAELNENDPVCAYAVNDITALSTKIVSYFEIEISIEYKRTKQQVDSRVAVSNTRYLKSELLSVMSEYRDELLIETSLRGLTADDIIGYVTEIYYDSPRSIVMMPVTAVEIYPDEGLDKIYEVRFAYSQQPDFLTRYGESLSGAVRKCAAVAGGDNDGEILLSLAEILIGACVYDAGTAHVISEHGTQNLSATAYGSLVLGSAVGEGFAMAYKALCEELGYDCTVITGYLGGMVHAWNIVLLYGDYYHIDVSMCAENGIETVFLKTDTEMMEHYTWDFVSAHACHGALTYEEVAGIEIIDPEDPDGPDDEEDSGDEEDEDDENPKGSGDEIGNTEDEVEDTAGSEGGQEDREEQGEPPSPEDTDTQPGSQPGDEPPPDEGDDN